MIPEIYAEMSIVFENDLDVSVISKLLNISPHEFQSQSNDTKVSPITNKKLEGFWTIRSDIFHEFDLKVATDNLIQKIDCKIQLIQQICKDNDGCVIFYIVAQFDKYNTPAIYFEKDFLDIVHELNATIQTDLYVE